MSQRLANKVAVITGAGSGIGRATAVRFHAEGACVVLGDISGAQHALAQELGDRAVSAHADVRNLADVTALLALATEAFGGLDIVCNIAGAPGQFSPLNETTVESFDYMLDVNLRSIFMMMKHALPKMLERGGGSIVNVASMAGLLGTPNLSGYSASKGGVVTLTKTAAIEYASRGVRVNAICPGLVDTPMMRGVIQSAADRNANSVTQAQMSIPIGRQGRPEEVASAALFLASDESSYITGIALPVDGGFGAA